MGEAGPAKKERQTVNIRQYRAEDALAIIGRGTRQPGGVALDEMTDQLAKAKESRGPAVTAIADEKIVACGGIEVVWPGVAEAWCLFPHAMSHCEMLPRHAKRILQQWIEDYQLVRVQAPLRADFQTGIRFAEWLGFRCEGRLRRYHPDGCDALMHSIIVER